MSDTTTTLNPGTGGDSMDESLVTQSDGTTQAKRPRVVPGDDAGNLFGKAYPMPVQDNAQRLSFERDQLLAISRIGISLSTRSQDRVRWGNRLDLIDSRGPGGR